MQLTLEQLLVTGRVENFDSSDGAYQIEDGTKQPDQDCRILRRAENLLESKIVKEPVL